MINYFKEIFSYSGMIKSLTRQDLRGRYKASVLGFLWTFINPLLQLGVYTFVFSIVLNARGPNTDPFYLFLFVALVPFIFFSSCLAGGANVLIANGDLVKKVYFPREVLPISYVLSNFINMALSFIVVLLALIIFGTTITLNILYLPVIMVIEFIFCLGVTLIASSCTLYFRDLQQILGIVTMAWQFATPVMYSLDIVPKEILPLFQFNPMTHIIVAYRDVLFYGQPPGWFSMLLAFGCAVVVMVIGFLVFSRLKRHFVEEM